ncbi:hypothetical protein IRJ41_005742 [Triplophysa rosa]|uniref:Uncharacterized protein n=1 Tax=Triplophysa rosa TaxID=992332 RepID=A0A9W7WVE4_TRIRA|nr:hypothetical protein IRJ41_005742 [Triplophysa rosa]
MAIMSHTPMIQRCATKAKTKLRETEHKGVRGRGTIGSQSMTAGIEDMAEISPTETANFSNLQMKLTTAE